MKMKYVLSALALLMSASLSFGALPKKEATLHQANWSVLPADVLWRIVLLEKHPIKRADLLMNMSKVNKAFKAKVESGKYAKQREKIISRAKAIKKEELAQFLKDNKIIIEYGENPAFLAVTMGNLEALKLLLDPTISGELSQDKNILDPNTNLSLLAKAISEDKKEIFDFLVKEKKVDINKGRTKPIILAITKWSAGNTMWSKQNPYYLEELLKAKGLVIDNEVLDFARSANPALVNLLQEYLEKEKTQKKDNN